MDCFAPLAMTGVLIVRARLLGSLGLPVNLLGDRAVGMAEVGELLLAA